MPTTERRRARHRRGAWLVVAIALAATTACGGGTGPGIGAVGGELPTVELESPDGSITTSAALTGQPLVINFWFSTCAPCVFEMPDFEEVHRDVGEAIRIVGVNPMDDAADAAAFARELGVSYETYRDIDGALPDETAVTLFPTTLFVDADGTIVHHQAGALDATRLRAAIAEHLGVAA